MRALVVRFSAIGDCVMAVPVAAAIRDRHPDAHIVWAVEPRCSPVIDRDRLVSELALFPRDEWEAHRWSPSTWFDQIRAFASMRKHRFDIGIDLQGQAKTAICLRIAKPKKRIAVSRKDAFTGRLNPILEAPNRTHVIERHMLALSKLGDFSMEPHWLMPRLAEERARFRSTLPRKGRLATISISSGSPKKTYPSEGWAAVARRLIQDGWTVAFLGGPGDPKAPISEAVDLVGRLPLRDTMAAVAESDLHLAADTGTGHMAAAYGVPVVSVFSTGRALFYRPYTDNGLVVEGERVVDVTPDQILEAACALMEGQS